MQSAKVASRRDPESKGVIKFRCSLSNTILDVLRNRGWQELGPEDESFDFFWCTIEWMRDNFDHKYLADHVRLCHFRNHFELTRKNLMVRNLKRAKKKFEKETGCRNTNAFDFMPPTFELPMEYHMFLEEFRRNPGSIWIMKPVAKSQGKGIFLFRRLKDIEAWKRGSSFNYFKKNEVNTDADAKELPEHYVVSRYIDNPYLIGGRKFDLRVYVLVTSFQPLKAWVYRDGFARLSNVGFSMESIDDQYIHLTNVAIQKTAPDYDAMKGCKWSICRLRRYMLARHGFERVAKLFREIDKIFILSLLSVQKVMVSDKHCFELYGYDILVDNSLKPWLLEINASPSLTASSSEDYALKVKLLGDTLNVVDMEGRLNGDERRIGDFDCVWDGGPVAPIANASKSLLCELQAGLNPAVSTGLQFSHQVRLSQQAPSGTTGNSRVQQNNGKKNFVDCLPLSPLNSYLGCLSLRKCFEDEVYTYKGLN